MSKDTIYRQAAINEVQRFLGYIDQDMIDRIKMAIGRLPSAEPRWIPVTERLPEDDTEVIVSCTDDSGDGEFSYVTTGWHFKGLWIVNNERCFFVRAWQPLPEKPYREE